MARQATRWWSAPVRFTADAAAALRRAGDKPRAQRGSWLAQSPVGIRVPLSAQ